MFGVTWYSPARFAVQSSDCPHEAALPRRSRESRDMASDDCMSLRAGAQDGVLHQVVSSDASDPIMPQQRPHSIREGEMFEYAPPPCLAHFAPEFRVFEQPQHVSS